jgi:hypothetical protein
MRRRRRFVRLERLRSTSFGRFDAGARFFRISGIIGVAEILTDGIAVPTADCVGFY